MKVKFETDVEDTAVAAQLLKDVMDLCKRLGVGGSFTLGTPRPPIPEWAKREETNADGT